MSVSSVIIVRINATPSPRRMMVRQLHWQPEPYSDPDAEVEAVASVEAALAVVSEAVPPVEVVPAEVGKLIKGATK